MRRIKTIYKQDDQLVYVLMYIYDERKHDLSVSVCVWGLQVLLFGGSDTYPDDKVMQVTLAFNHFGKGLVQRMPRIRWGFVHVVNNDYTHWLMYAIGGSQQPTVISQGNRFVAPPSLFAKEVNVLNLLIEIVMVSPPIYGPLYTNVSQDMNHTRHKTNQSFFQKNK